MYTTVNPEGQLNNYANVPKVYAAEYPSPAQQRRYAQQAAFAFLLVSATLLIAVGVS